MKDTTGRLIDYVRISVTDRCNFRCCYCMPAEGITPLAHQQVMRLEEIEHICSILTTLGIRKFKISGGEPLVRKGVVEMIARLKQMDGVEQVTLTTNGVLLENCLPQLKEAGLDGINISIDSLQEERYREITRGGKLQTALSAIEAAYQADFCPVKLNAVLLAGINDDEITNLAAMAKDRNISVRFIELMPIGFGAGKKVISGESALQMLTDAFGAPEIINKTLGNGPAHYYQFPGFKGAVGLIDAVSHRFCESCNRVRITSDGLLKLCLNFDIGTDLLTPLRSGISDQELGNLIRDTIAKKPAGHQFHEKNCDHWEARNMNSIGG